VTSSLVVESTDTALPGLASNSTPVTCWKSVPVTVTRIPPEVGPEVGLTRLTRGGATKVKWSLATSADLPAAVQCLAVGVVHAAGTGQVRLHLQFDSGQVLPIEMSRDAASALARALTEHAGTR